MSLNKVLDDIRNITPNLPPDQRIAFVRERIDTIEDEAEKEQAWLFFSSVLEGLSFGRQKVAFLVHGIRTNAEWQSKLKKLIASEVASDVKVFTPRYGFLNIFSFLLPKFVIRWHAIRKIRRQLRRVISDYPLNEITLVAHSFGTYIVSKILKGHPDIKIERLLLCGAIVKENFKWDELQNSPALLLNDCGTKDYLPILAKSVWFGGYGSSGIKGFHCQSTNNRYHCIGHSDFFCKDFMKEYWLPFIENGEIVESSWTTERPNLNYFLNIVHYLLIPILVLIIVGLYKVLSLLF